MDEWLKDAAPDVQEAASSLSAGIGRIADGMEDVSIPVNLGMLELAIP